MRLLAGELGQQTQGPVSACCLHPRDAVAVSYLLWFQYWYSCIWRWSVPRAIHKLMVPRGERLHPQMMFRRESFGKGLDQGGSLVSPGSFVGSHMDTSAPLPGLTKLPYHSGNPPNCPIVDCGNEPQTMSNPLSLLNSLRHPGIVIGGVPQLPHHVSPSPASFPHPVKGSLLFDCGLHT